MMMITITDPVGQSVTLHGDPLTVPPGSFILETPTGLPGLPSWRGEKHRRIGTGFVLDPVTRDGRIIQISGFTHRPGLTHDEACAAAQSDAFMLTGLWPDRSRRGVLRYQHAGLDVSCEIQPDPGYTPTIDLGEDYEGWFRFRLQFVAPDPYLYGPAGAVTMPAQGSGIGLVFPPFTPAGVLDFGTAPTYQAQVMNRGNAPAPLVVEVAGDLPSGFTIDAGPAGQVTFAGAVVPGAPPVRVDLSGQVTQGTADVSDLVSAWSWGYAPPGQPVTVDWWAPQGIGGATAYLSDTWI